MAGKTATLCLLYAFPLLFLGSHDASYAEVTRIIGWMFAIWGSALYWWAAGLYVVQARQLLAETHAGLASEVRPDGARRGGSAAVKAVVMAGGEGTRLRARTV